MTRSKQDATDSFLEKDAILRAPQLTGKVSITCPITGQISNKQRVKTAENICRKLLYVPICHSIIQSLVYSKGVLWSHIK